MDNAIREDLEPFDLEACITALSDSIKDSDTPNEIATDDLSSDEEQLEDDVEKASEQFLDIKAEISAVDEEDEEYGVFEGYGSIFNNTDLGNDVIVNGAFTKSIKKTGAKGVKLLYQHKTDMPIGVYESIEEDEKGLKVRGRLAMKTQAGRETYELMKMGALDGLSIGFRTSPKGQSYDPKTRVRKISEVELMEISVVTFPMNPKAKVQKVKGQELSIREWENGLRDAFSLSRSEAKMAAKAVQDAFTQRDAEEKVNPDVESIKNLTQKLKTLLGEIQ
jgi:HK97 family phage prohead protease|tara:strand:+ start:250 stop:1083 length:834 start_codon:yes stop_codon:yes gene_type:complete